MAQDLNTVQRTYVNEVVRPMIERLVKIRYELDQFIAEASNQQDAIANNTEILSDGEGGIVPRSDAPSLTGQNVSQLVAFVTAMQAQLDGAALNALITLMVRDVRTVVGSE